jgi:nitroreductase
MVDFTPEKFLDLVRRRTSCRKYLEAPVPDKLIDQCIDAARLAPSACNKQPWRFITVKSPKLRNEISSKCLLPGVPMPWLKKAPVIVVMCTEKSLFTHSIAPMVSGVHYQYIDLGIAGEHFVLTAEAAGLGTCWIGWFKERALKKLLSIPRNVQVVSLLSLGYPKELTKPSSRKSAEEISFVNTWGSISD